MFRIHSLSGVVCVKMGISFQPFLGDRACRLGVDAELCAGKSVPQVIYSQSSKEVALNPIEFHWVTRLSLAVLTGFFILAVGCASSGTNYDSTKVSDIKKGVTTEAQLVQMFGDPEQTTTNSEGDTILMWRYNEARANAASFVPGWSIFGGGTNTSNKMLRVTLKSGIVSDFSATEGTGGARHGTESPS
jgi:hypothetical protein